MLSYTMGKIFPRDLDQKIKSFTKFEFPILLSCGFEKKAQKYEIKMLMGNLLKADMF